jgi:hypothetical protein
VGYEAVIEGKAAIRDWLLALLPAVFRVALSRVLGSSGDCGTCWMELLSDRTAYSHHLGQSLMCQLMEKIGGKEYLPSNLFIPSKKDDKQVKADKLPRMKSYDEVLKAWVVG